MGEAAAVDESPSPSFQLIRPSSAPTGVETAVISLALPLDISLALDE